MNQRRIQGEAFINKPSVPFKISEATTEVPEQGLISEINLLRRQLEIVQDKFKQLSEELSSTLKPSTPYSLSEVVLEKVEKSLVSQEVSLITKDLSSLYWSINDVVERLDI